MVTRIIWFMFGVFVSSVVTMVSLCLLVDRNDRFR